MKALLFIALFISSSVGVFGQSLTANVNRTSVPVGDNFQVSFTVEGDASGFEAPDFKGFQILSGPNKSSSMQWVNGNFSSSVSYSYILRPLQEGELVIGEAQLKNKSGTVSSNPIKINVVKGRQQAQSQQQQQRQRGTQSNQQASDDLSSHVFMKLVVDKKEAFVGEQLVATYKLYYDVDLGQAVPKLDPFNGFYTEDLKIDPNQSQKRERLNGREYVVATMKRVILTPQKSGELQIPAMELSLVARIPEKRRRRSIFDDFFGNYRNVRVTTKSNPEKINVKPLPKAGQPSEFAGAVGQFDVSAAIDRNQVTANDAINLTLTIEGRGNLALIAMPEVDIPVDFESYDPKTKESITTDAGGSRGKKTYEFVMIPRFAGDFEIDPIRFSYFDPKSERYKSVETDNIQVEVAEGTSDAANPSGGFSRSKKEDVQILGKDIRFIKTEDPELARSEDRFYGSTLFYMLCGLPFAGMFGAIFLFSFYRAQYGDEQAVKSKRAGSAAKKHLNKAKKQINASNEAFFDEISAALFGYIADKMSITTAELNREQIETELRSNNVSENLIGDLNKALDECDMVRFAPGVVRSKEEMLTASQEIIEALENEL